MNGKELLNTLNKIEEGETFDIFNLLPAIASGKVWLDEIKHTAQRMSEYIEADKDYDLDDLKDIGGEFANSAVEDYYSNINREVQALSLWASPEMDDHVEELFSGATDNTLTGVNSRYLYTAAWIVWDAVADQAAQNTPELEEAGL